MADKPLYEVVISPAGEAVFPWVTKADTEHDPAGVFHTDLSVPFELAQDFIARLEKIRNDFIATLPAAKQKALTVKPVYIEELTRPDYPEDSTKEQRAAIRAEWEGEPTGNVLFRFKLRAKVTTGGGDTFEQEPVVVSAETGEKIEQPVYGGSIIKVKAQVVPYTNAAAGVVGVTLRMKGVQVIDLVTGGGGETFWSDFDDEEAA